MKDNRDPIAEKIAEMEAEYLAKRPAEPPPKVGKLYQVSSSQSRRTYDIWLSRAFILRSVEPQKSSFVQKDIVDEIPLGEGSCVHILDFVPPNPILSRYGMVKIITPCGKIAWMSSALLETKPLETE